MTGQTSDDMWAALRAFAQAHNTQPERTMQAVEDEARQILRAQGFPDDWRAFAYTVTSEGRQLWECTPDERARVLGKLNPDLRSLIYEGPPLTPQADLARRALIEITAWRHARERGDARWAATFAEAARTLLDDARLHELGPVIEEGERMRQYRREGTQRSIEAKREAVRERNDVIAKLAAEGVLPGVIAKRMSISVSQIRRIIARK